MDSILQDENDIGLAGLNRPGMPLMGKGAAAGSVVQGKAGFSKTPARKAFGNITNFKGEWFCASLTQLSTVGNSMQATDEQG